MAPRAGLARLWAPWRMRYIRSAAEPAGCLFCRVARARDDRRNLVIHRGTRVLVMLNRFPYNPGHLMVAPLRHAASLGDLTPPERDELIAATILAEAALAAEYRPEAMNLGANLGRVAGAGFPGHLHFHLVPRWNGDTNFMPVVAETKVLPESLGRTWSRLARALAGQSPGAARGEARRAAAGRPDPIDERRPPAPRRAAARRRAGRRAHGRRG
jgi:ATP adenylyltransferase